MPTITTNDGTEIYYKDWGTGQPIMFHHGWPLSSDDWDAQLTYFVQRGYRVIAHDRRGHGRSSQVADGHDMDHYAADAAAVVEHLDLHDAVHVGHSTGGGEVARYVARHGSGRVAKAVLIGAVPPLMLQTRPTRADSPSKFRRLPGGHRLQPVPVLPRRRLRTVLRLQPTGVEGLARGHLELVAPGHDGQRQSPLRGNQGVLGDRLHPGPPEQSTVPTLVMHGDDDQVVPIADSAELSIKLLKNGTLKVYPGFPHGMCTTHADVINPDLLEFIQA